MADEFAKGLGLLSGAGLIWLVLAGWYRTPDFDGPQLTAEIQYKALSMYDLIAVQLMFAMFWLAIFGALFFWVLVPAGREVYAAASSE